MTSAEHEESTIISLRAHLSNWLFTPIFVLLLFSSVAGYVAAVTLSNRPYDKALLERAQLLGTQLGLNTGVPDLRPPADVLPNESDRLLFALRHGDGRLLIGNAELADAPMLPSGEKLHELREVFYLGDRLRQVTLRYARSAAHPGGDYVLLVAEPVSKRQQLVRSILAYVVVPQVLFIAIAAAAVWFGLKSGLRPLERLRREVAQRARDDLRPLDEMRAPDELRPLISAVNTMFRNQRQLMEAHNRFVADAAHQLRTPFAGLKTQAELALSEEEPERVRQALAGILTGAERCSHLVNQLLILARNEPGARTQASFELLDLNDVAQESASHWVPEALRKNIDLGFEGSSRTAPVRGDRASLTELFNTLLDNAIRYTPEGGAVTVHVDYQNGGAVAQVEDSGPGIPENARAQVFERFYRILGTGQPGCGLGLAIAREIAQSHGATITLDTGPEGHGTCATIRFPHHAS